MEKNTQDRFVTEFHKNVINWTNGGQEEVFYENPDGGDCRSDETVEWSLFYEGGQSMIETLVNDPRLFL